MAEQHLDELIGSSFSTSNFSNVRDSHSGIWYRIWGSTNTITNIIRMIFSMCRATAAVCGGRIYHDDADGDAQFSITSISFIYRGVVQTVTGSTKLALSGGDVTHHIYVSNLNTVPVVVVSDTGWPSAPHVRLGTITLEHFTIGCIDSRNVETTPRPPRL